MKFNTDDIEIVHKPSVKEAFVYALESKCDDEKVFCVGSLYMVGEIMEYIGKECQNDKI